MRALMMAVGLVMVFGSSAFAADSLQQRCDKEAAGMAGSARTTFISNCLAGTASHPKCNPGKSKPCGDSCISLDKTCHK